MTKIVAAYVPTAERRSVACGVRFFHMVVHTDIELCSLSFFSTDAVTTTPSLIKDTRSCVSLRTVRMIGI